MGTTTEKHKDLQPWLDYFDALKRLVHKGYLEVRHAEHEAYITHAALYAISNVCNPQDELVAIIDPHNLKDTANRIHTYAAFLSREGSKYTERSFALHVVEDEAPHNLFATVLIHRRRLWWKPWRRSEHIEVINYKNKQKKNGNKTEFRNQD